MKTGQILASGLVAASLFCGTTALAQDKPANSSKATKQQIVEPYSDATAIWDGECKGGIYFATDSSAQAYCDEGDEGLSVALGSWSVNGSGKLCFKVTYYFDDDGETGQENEKECIKHVVAPDGNLWVKYEGEGWFEYDEDNESGNALKSDIAKLRAQLGV
ncbi:Protein of unknown function [Ruegeria halocynthiae]|uniref:Uncharacterized protein n=1 Tax=Ruegeria halocynthiae TaxID=985054 RepID=A0A1H2YG03_9RHOB|nr:DUF995 domain-containing protein [Ruegeria halocynthiae]SDX03554.1 Protein of unknown function [Ruegeria halocynthiae]